MSITDKIMGIAKKTNSQYKRNVLSCVVGRIHSCAYNKQTDIQIEYLDSVNR